MKRIAVFGGSFDPVHLGHLEIIRSVEYYLGADKILVTPCGNPPHRSLAMASPEQRLAMLQIACNGYSSVEIDEREIRSNAISYTHTSIEKLRLEYPDALLYLVLGGDSFASFTTWYRWRDILAMACLVVAARGEEKRRPSKELSGQLGRIVRQATDSNVPKAGDLLELPFDRIDVSSTTVRKAFATETDTASLVLPEIADYIKENKLYRSH